ncbi:MAG: pyrrolo-quinoline quinone [Terriglobales bacterium]
MHVLSGKRVREKRSTLLGFRVSGIFLVLVLAGCGSGAPKQSSNQTVPESPPGAGSTPTPSRSPSGQVAVVTRGYDNARTGANLNETVLSPANVNTATFSKLFSFSFEGDAYAQPLYVPKVPIPGQGTHNVIYVATEHDTVYAFDADGNTANPLWTTSFINPTAGIVPIDPLTDFGLLYEDISREIGITGTPVIDPSSGTLYVVAKTNENGTFVQRLHALDIASGAEKFGGPVVIDPTFPGQGVKNDGNGNDVFDPLVCNQRAALLFQNGIVYVAFGSHGDLDPFMGWVLGFNAQTLKLVTMFVPTPDDAGGSIWQSGGGPAADVSGNIFVSVSNGGFDVPNGGRDYGDSFVRLTTTGNQLEPADYFAPFDQQVRNDNDWDLGSGGVMVVPDQSFGPRHLLIGGDKEGLLFVINRDSMGHFNATDNRNALQTLEVNGGEAANQGIFASPAYWNGQVYIGGVGNPLQSFRLSSGRMTLSSQSASVFAYPGITPAVSANGNTNGIVWAMDVAGFDSGFHTTLHAFDANNLATELYNSDIAAARDTAPGGVKFTIPTIANGKVYVAGRDGMAVYGLLSH